MDRSMNFTTYCEELEQDIKNAYENSPTIEESEKLAAKFLTAQIETGKALQVADLDSRMRRSGLKAIKAAVYLKAATADSKKPSDVLIGALVDSDKLVMGEQEAFDGAEVYKNRLENYLSVFRDAHIYFRALAKGRFE